ncbi:MAG TPA: SMP-30/gluconolactonase/LRE family protein [Polyangiaceae bacterium]|jgi:D-xylonolactonase
MNLQAVANYHCHTGENPLYHPEEGKIYWEDIPAGRLFRADHASGRHECFHEGDVVGGFTFQADGSLLLFEVDRIARLRDGERTVLVEGIDADMERFNDVIADPEGRVYAGTIGKTNTSGGLYLIERDASVRCLFKGSGCANGMAFTPELDQFYWTCSTRRKIYRFRYDRRTGELSERQDVVTVEKGEGVPDGLAVDLDGNLWSARWDGHGIFKYAPDGKLLEKIDFPVAKVSSAAFGGPAFDVLYATTAGGSPSSASADGTLYRLDVAAKGRPEFRSEVLLG